MQQLPTDKEALLDLLDDLIAKRLLHKAKTEMTPVGPNAKPSEDKQAAEIVPLLQEDLAETLPAEFAKVEKNLVSLGFFTPSSKRIKDAKAKTISINATVGGNRIEAKATIAPAALYGLPITADQDKYLALQKLITDLRQREGGQIANPISFTSAELLHVLSQADAGKNYREIDEWLNIMSSTTIISEGAVYLAGKKRFVKDRFHVFDRAVSFGKEIEPGVIADRNYVWFSDWQLENINNNYLIPVDLETYRQLRNHIAKTLVPLLQVWLFASRKEGSFEKRYDELCQILSIRQYHYLSRVKEQLGPSLDELQHHGYLAGWAVEETSSGKEYKLVFRHGEKFHRDRRRRLAAKDGSQKLPEPPPSEEAPPKNIQAPRPRQARLQLRPEIDSGLLAELTNRGVGESGAKKLLAKLPADRPVRDLLEWGDQEIARQPGKISNPAGFYIRLLEEHSAPPPTFEPSRVQKARVEAESARARAIVDQQQAQLAAEEAETADLNAQIENLPQKARLALLSQAKADLLSRQPKMADYLKTHPEADSAIRARARIMLKDGLQLSKPVGPQSVAEAPHPVDAKIGLHPAPAIADVLNLKAILSTPQLTAPDVEQAPVKPELPPIGDPQK